MSQQMHSPSKLSPSLNRIGLARKSDLLAKSLLSGPLLVIYVGAEGKHWMLHRDLLRYHSRYFDEEEYVNGEPKRINDGKLELPDEDCDAFRLLVKWLYQGSIQDVTLMEKDKKWDYAFTCQKLYMLCERLGIQELKNQAIDQFRKGCFEAGLVPGADEIKPVYERTPPESPFRKLVSKIAARQIMDPDSQRDASVYRECFQAAPEFAIDVLNAIRDGTEGLLLDDPTEGNSCRYHEHANGETCHKTVKFKELP